MSALGIQQTPHPIIPVIEEEVLLSMPEREAASLVVDREAAIRLEREDPYRGGHDAPFWRRVDRLVAEMRLALREPVVIEVGVLGGIRSGKTDFCAKRLVQHFMHTRDAWVWALHETERSSQTIGQARIYKYLPAEYRTASGKLKATAATKLNYKHGQGFTGGFFTLHGRLCDFKFYGADNATLQGAEITMGWSDELVPKNVAQTVTERLLTRAAEVMAMRGKVMEALRLMDEGKAVPAELLAAVYHGVHLLSFTPKEGYSPMVAELMDGAVTVEDVEAELLPELGPEGDGGVRVVLGHKRVPRVKRGRKPHRAVVYFHTYDNVYGGNWPGLKAQLVGAREDEVRVTAYGDVRKAWSSRFPRFSDQVHVVKLSQVPRAGTWYHRVDPCDTRNFFMTWWLVSGNRHYCVREWPQLGDYIEGVGDPGEWAVTSEKGKMDGDAGPAQESYGFGLEDYRREIERVEKELAGWFHEGHPAPPERVEVFERHMDSRFGNAPSPSRDEATTLIEEFGDMGMDFEPAPGEHLTEGVNLINDALAYDESRPVGVLNSPKLYVVNTCAAMIYAFQNWTGKDGQKGACKDPVDTARYHFTAGPEDMAGQPLMVRRARAAY